MKKILFLMVILFSCFAANAQFQVTVRLTGDCIYPDQNTYYVVIVRVYNTVTNQFYDPAYSVTQTTNYQGPVDITVQLDDFCTADNTQIYRIFVDARKIYADQREICSGKITAPQLQSCNDFLNNVSLIQNPVLLE